MYTRDIGIQCGPTMCGARPMREVPRGLRATDRAFLHPLAGLSVLAVHSIAMRMLAMQIKTEQKLHPGQLTGREADVARAQQAFGESTSNNDHFMYCFVEVAVFYHNRVAVGSGK